MLLDAATNPTLLCPRPRTFDLIASNRLPSSPPHMLLPDLPRHNDYEKTTWARNDLLANPRVVNCNGDHSFRDNFTPCGSLETKWRPTAHIAIDRAMWDFQLRATHKHPQKGVVNCNGDHGFRNNFTPCGSLETKWRPTAHPHRPNRRSFYKPCYGLRSSHPVEQPTDTPTRSGELQET